MAADSSSSFSVLNLIDLPPDERAIFVEIARNGPLSADELGAATRASREAVDAALARLAREGRIRILADGRVDVQLGRVAKHTTLPAEMWPALLSPHRLYTQDEIATLKTALPMLQFVRANMSLFADHGPNHGLRVKAFVTQLSYVVGLTETERHLARAAALFHDVGNVVEREHHHIISESAVERLASSGELPFEPDEAHLVSLLCRWHRKEYEPERVDWWRGEIVRTGLTASVLRMADAMDIDSRRSDYDEKFRHALEFFFPQQRQYFTSLEEVLGVRVHCKPAVNLEVMTRGVVADNMQIKALEVELANTPLEWTIREIPVMEGDGEPIAIADKGGRAVVMFPFDAHSLVMAALSRKQLEKAGYEIELVSYPDTAGGSQWLWGDLLKNLPIENRRRLIVIGDRPARGVTKLLVNSLARWQEQGVQVSSLNRHEANWSRIQALLDRGVEVILGTDWAYFWGEKPTRTDIEWARIAALCARDPTMGAIPISPEDQAIMRGLLYSLMSALTHAVRESESDTAAWTARAEAIIGRIAADDRKYFAGLESAFVKEFATPRTQGEVRGRVLVFDQPPGATPQAFYWMMEAAIEEQGLIPGRSAHFRIPYAIATWRSDGQVELLALSHWREEEATPIRLLYPDLAPTPEGTENSLDVRLTPDDAEWVVERLIAECNG